MIVKTARAHEPVSSSMRSVYQGCLPSKQVTGCALPLELPRELVAPPDGIRTRNLTPRSPDWIRTSNPDVNSISLYQLELREIKKECNCSPVVKAGS